MLTTERKHQIFSRHILFNVYTPHSRLQCSKLIYIKVKYNKYVQVHPSKRNKPLIANIFDN